MADEFAKLVKYLDMVPYPGNTDGSMFFREVYRSGLKVKPLGDERAERKAFTSIYVLMRSGLVGFWRKLKSDETFYYHKGNSLRIATITDGNFQEVMLGDTLMDRDAIYQYTIPANSWLNYRVVDQPEQCGLYGVAVAPGFELDDTTILEDPGKLIEEFPKHKKAIEDFLSTNTRK